MLHGRESLIRLIGKRRRAFSSPLARSLRSKDDYDSGGAMSVNSKEHEPVAHGGGEMRNTGERSSGACAEWVSCPVCSASVPGDVVTVNSHLGMVGIFRATLSSISRAFDLPSHQKAQC